jgi:AraC-like DNA-binding protein
MFAKNAILRGRAARYAWGPGPGALSIKSVLRGKAAWTTRAGRYELEPGQLLVLNEGEEYSIEVDALQPVETFCLFFAPGFVDDARRALITSSDELLDTGVAPRVEFFERVRFDRDLTDAVASSSFVEVAEALVRSEEDVETRIARLPSLRDATRRELARRLGIAAAVMHARSGEALHLDDVASEACLSPFHLHRLFRGFFGETPHRYLTRIRLERARALLRGTRRGVAEIANECGFESIGSFTTLFTRTFGVPPSRFRKNEEDALAAAR